MVFVAGCRRLCVGQVRIGRHRNVPTSSFSPYQLRKGIEVQREHTDSPSIAQQISKDHLAEVPDYYSRLLRMQKQAKMQWEVGAPPMESKDEEVDDATFAAKLENKKPGLVFVFFYMSHCPHCRRMMPTVERMVQQQPHLYLLRCDIKRCPSMQQHMQVQFAPTSFLMKDGKWVDRIDGAITDEELQTRVLAVA